MTSRKTIQDVVGRVEDYQAAGKMQGIRYYMHSTLGKFFWKVCFIASKECENDIRHIGRYVRELESHNGGSERSLIELTETGDTLILEVS